eukprot:CAMPEP_0182909430 /NCGR_PEP_ID=MMETSP0034_2-20130328/35751_1 /TAXON_ID=156128 /ORGANISM="Nephroselmis pyriformis, Strain CCMP717" /LENGTH=34 /DNA_ID= /DNA_START= /DNA_END= /DNA_ORIENTATION=
MATRPEEAVPLPGKVLPPLCFRMHPRYDSSRPSA